MQPASLRAWRGIRRRCLGAALLALAACTAATAQIQVDGDHVYPARVELAGQTVQLNGAGYRAVAWIKGYAAALYLPRKATTVADVLAQDGPKRVQMKMLLEVSTQEFVKAIHKGVGRNTPATQHAGLSQRLAEFDAQVSSVGKVKAGDLVDLDYLPEQGMVFRLNGQPRGRPIPGRDFYDAVLLIFLGQRPVDKELKAGMLGGPVA